jgi:hypothetical protein
MWLYQALQLQKNAKRGKLSTQSKLAAQINRLHLQRSKQAGYAMGATKRSA